MRLLEARLVLKSPAVITQKRLERGFVKPADYVPGSMLRGAILAAMYRAGRLSIDDLRREREEPSLLASPAYPVIKNSKSMPATPFMFYCRRRDTIVDFTVEAAKKLARGEEPELLLHRECEEPLKPIHGSLVARDGHELRRVSLETYRSTSVAIGKDRGTAMRGMLFDYEAIVEGAEFWSWILAPDWLKPSTIEVVVGRGASRGFGWAELGLEPAVERAPGENVFIALSPLIPLKRLEWREYSVSLARVYGRVEELQAGWEYGSGFRPFVKVARRGSIIITSGVSCPQEVLLAGLPVKTGDTWLTGFNVFVPLAEYQKTVGG